MKLLKKSLIVLFLLLILLICPTFALPSQNQQLQIDYYGVVTSSEDTNMLKMAQDLFFAQLQSIDNASVDDKRINPAETNSVLPDFSSSTGNRIVFYAEIIEKKQESAQTQWICTFNAKNLADNKTQSKTEEYDSYYKILVNAKTAIEAVISPFREIEKIPDSIDSSSRAMSAESGTFSIEYLAGTWSGEPFTDKIIILRSGRGFIIFKNGATMNIEISIESANGKSVVKIKQTGKQNASFYPNLPREEALKVAQTASPIVWTFTEYSETKLSGTKITTPTQSEQIVWQKK